MDLSEEKIKKIILNFSEEKTNLEQYLNENSMEVKDFFTNVNIQLQESVSTIDKKVNLHIRDAVHTSGKKEVNFIKTEEVEWLYKLSSLLAKMDKFINPISSIILFPTCEQLMREGMEIMGKVIGFKSVTTEKIFKLLFSSFRDIFIFTAKNFKEETINFFLYNNQYTEEIFKVLFGQPQIREFIYSFYRITHEDIMTHPGLNNFHARVKDILLSIIKGFKPEVFPKIDQEIIQIAMTYKDNFGIVNIPFAALIGQILTIKIKKEKIRFLFESLAKVIFDELEEKEESQRVFNTSFANSYLDIYKKEIMTVPNQKKTKIMIEGLFSSINKKKYEFLVYKTVFNSSFIGTLYNLRNIKNNNSIVDKYFELISNFSKEGYKVVLEIKEFIKIIPLFSEENYEMMKIVFDNLKQLIGEDESLLEIIFKETEYFKYEREIMKSSSNKRIKKYIHEFTKWMLETNKDKFSFVLPDSLLDFNSNISIEENYLLLFYEKDIKSFNKKVREVTQLLACILNERNNFNMFIEAVEKILRVLSEKSLSFGNTLDNEFISGITSWIILFADNLMNFEQIQLVESFTKMILDYVIFENQSLIKYRMTKSIARKFLIEPIITTRIIKDTFHKFLSPALAQNSTQKAIKSKVFAFLTEQIFPKDNLLIEFSFLLVNLEEYVNCNTIEIMEKLEKALERSEVNIKTLMCFNITKVIMDLMILNSDDMDTMKVLMNIFEKICPYFTKEALMIAFEGIFEFMKEKRALIFVRKLFDTISVCSACTSKRTLNYFSLSPFTFDSIYIYNFLYLPKLSPINNKFSINFFLSVSSYNKLSKFYLLKIISDSGYQLDLFLDKDKIYLAENGKDTAKFPNPFKKKIDYNVSVTIDQENSTVVFTVDDKEISKQSLPELKNSLGVFELGIGFLGGDIYKETSKTFTGVNIYTIKVSDIEYTFKNQKIFQGKIDISKEFCYEEASEHFTPYIEEGNRLYLLSKNDNVKEFLVKNCAIKMENLHKKLICDKYFLTFGVDKYINDKYFIDFLLGFLYKEKNEEDDEEENEDCLDEMIVILILFASSMNTSIKNYFNTKVIKNLKHIIIKLLDDLKFNSSDTFKKIIQSCKEKKNFDLLSVFYTDVVFDQFCFSKISAKAVSFLIENLKDFLQNYPLSQENLGTFSDKMLTIILQEEDLQKEIYEPLFEVLQIIKQKITEERILVKFNKKSDEIHYFFENHESLVKKHEGFRFVSYLSSAEFFERVKKFTEVFPSKAKIEPLDNTNPCLYCKVMEEKFVALMKYIKEKADNEKKKIDFYRKNYLLFSSFRENFDKTYLSWYLSSKECLSRMRNRLFLKRTDTRLKNGAEYNFLYNKEYFKEEWKLMEPYMKFSLNTDFSYVNGLVEEDDVLVEKYNCLYVKKMMSTKSVLLIAEKTIYLYTNLVLTPAGDLIGGDTLLQRDFWCLEDFESEWNNRCLSKPSQTDAPRGFGLANYKHSIKKILYKDIIEVHKKTNLNIDNAIEIFLKNGNTYFLVFNLPYRDLVFEHIVKKCSKNPKINIPKNGFFIKKSPITNEKNSVVVIDDLLKYSLGLWSDGKMSNFDYIMLLNTLSGRSYNQISQYMVFPWIMINFFDKFDVIDDNSYRDLKFPVHASSQERRDHYRMNYETNDFVEEKCHSGTFYSTTGFLSFFLVRIRPFTEVSLEIQGCRFDTPDRIFSDAIILSEIEDKYQELVPELFYFPEVLVNINNLNFGYTQKKKKVDNVLLPSWSMKDPRFFINIHRKILESKKVSERLNLWFDMVFGVAQQGEGAAEIVGIYRRACFPFTREQINEKIKKNELIQTLYEVSELGSSPNKLFNEEHEVKAKCEWLTTPNYFFSPTTKKCMEEQKLQHNKVGEIEFTDKDLTYYLGGVSSLFSNVNMTNFVGKQRFAMVGRGNVLLGVKKKKYLTFKDNILKIVYPKYDLVYEFKLDTTNRITCVTTDHRGKYIIVGFDNGEVIKFKLKFKKTEYFTISEGNFEFKKKEGAVENQDVNQSSTIILPKIEVFTGPYDYAIIDIEFESRNALKDEEIKQFKVFYLVQNCEPITFPMKKIRHVKINEPFSLLIICDISNLIYLYTLYSLSLINISEYLTFTSCPIDFIVPIRETGEFLIVSKIFVYLFNANGIPLAEVSLKEKILWDISPITCVDVVYKGDLILFTGHDDGSIVMWKLKDKDTNCKFELRESYKQNQSNTKSFLDEYDYGYKHKDFPNIEEFELKRKFDKIKKINPDDINGIASLKLVNERVMVIVDKNQKVYTIEKEINVFEERKSQHSSIGVLKSDRISAEDDMFAKYEKRCQGCGRRMNEADEVEGRKCINDSTSEGARNTGGGEYTDEIMCDSCKGKICSPEDYIYS